MEGAVQEENRVMGEDQRQLLVVGLYLMTGSG